jgi:hypothetical protein
MVSGVYLGTGYKASIGLLLGLDCDTYDTINASVSVEQGFALPISILDQACSRCVVMASSFPCSRT